MLVNNRLLDEGVQENTILCCCFLQPTRLTVQSVLDKNPQGNTFTRPPISCMPFFASAVMGAHGVDTGGIHVAIMAASDALIDI